MGSFKNYMDKMRWVDGQKICQFLSTFRVKNVHVEVGRKVVKKGQNFVYVGIE